jgi:hypothetical protein
VGSIATFIAASVLTFLDLDRTFYVPSNALRRARLWAWWWGFVTANGALAVVLYLGLRDFEPFVDMNETLAGLAVGLGYLALVRVKFSTFRFEGQDVPFGLEAFYEAGRQLCYTRINRIARDARISEAEDLATRHSLVELGRRARLITAHDRLVTREQQASILRWIHTVLTSNPVSEDEKKEALANFILSGDRLD